MNKSTLVVCSLIALLALGTVGAVWAQAPDQVESPQQAYNLGWHTVDGGGYTWSRGGTYSLGGTVGQPDAGNLTGGSYALDGGFWGPAAQVVHRVYLPLVLRSGAP